MLNSQKKEMCYLKNDQKQYSYIDYLKYGKKLITNFFKNYSINQYQIDSYNHFLNFELSKIIENEPDIIIRDKVDPNIIIYRVNFSNVFIEKPYIQNKNRMKEILYPNIARLKNLNYDSNIKINIKERILVKKTERNEDLKKLLYKSDYVCDNIDCKFKKKQFVINIYLIMIISFKINIYVFIVT